MLGGRIARDALALSADALRRVVMLGRDSVRAIDFLLPIARDRLPIVTGLQRPKARANNRLKLAAL